MKVLVTGGAGFIGSNFVHHVLHERADWQVTVLDALTYAGNIKNLDCLDKARFKFIKGNICDPEVVNSAVAACDMVVHFAAESHVDNSIQEPWPFVNTNIV